MLVSALLSHGIEQLEKIEQDMVEWLEAKEYDSIAQLQGSLSQINCPDSSVFERAQYLKALQTYQPYWKMVNGTYVRNYAK